MNKRFDIGYICQFSMDDFKTKYAGSLLGFVWAFIQPIITVVIYWFIFQIGFKNEPIGGVPFIVWLVSGIVPWFFISDAIVNATSSLVEYSYLVKKVVFNIDILPLAKIVSVLFIQIILLVFASVLFIAYGVDISVYWLQIPYYIIYMMILCTGITYLTASLYVFFKDITQIVSIIIQVVFWLTPIVWQMKIMPENIQVLLRFNPVFYAVNGYRDALIHKKWFFEYSIGDNIYYWVIALILLLIGTYVFRKLKPHFADVL
ncbi:MAG: ABC transporter permease [Lachnospiraceae bacterium]|nr:ABC transporter permease [Lachnospiraceae bacterium]